MQLSDERIHEGHRARMRAKLREHGARIFDTYELLEMLLYYVVPYKDTNPISKRLLARFGSLDGVLRASEAELAEVDGIGAKAAAFLAAVGRLTDLTALRGGDTEPPVFDDFNRAGEFFVDYFDRNKKVNIVLLLLDDCMRLLGVERIPGDNFSSASVHPKHFISAALRYHATIAIIGYTHRGSVAYPYSGDYETCRMLRYELNRLGINLVEQFIVGGNEYNGSSMELRFNSPPTEALRRFLRSKEEACQKD